MTARQTATQWMATVITVLIGSSAAELAAQEWGPAEGAARDTAVHQADWAQSAADATDSQVIPATAVEPLQRWRQSTAGATASVTPGPVDEAAPSSVVISPSPTSGYVSNDRGQIYREYDIRPYTLRVAETSHPESAIVSWILHETGYEAWHGDTVSILSPTRDRLRVYHTPEMQAQVETIVRRFVDSRAQAEAFSLKVVSVDHPSWRTRVHRLLQPVKTQTPSVTAWIAQPEHAAQIQAELQRRSDYREHSTPFFAVANGQPGIVSSTSPRTFTKDARASAEVWPGYESEVSVIDAGFALEFVPLIDMDNRIAEATVRLDIDHVEELIGVMLDMPTEAAPRQRTKVETPQVVQYRMHEKFRWPIDQVLILDLGMIPLPTPGVSPSNPLDALPLPIGKSSSRVNVLVFIERRSILPNSPAASNSTPATASRSPYGVSTRSRY